MPAAWGATEAEPPPPTHPKQEKVVKQSQIRVRYLERRYVQTRFSSPRSHHTTATATALCHCPFPPLAHESPSMVIGEQGGAATRNPLNLPHPKTLTVACHYCLVRCKLQLLLQDASGYSHPRGLCARHSGRRPAARGINHLPATRDERMRVANRCLPSIYADPR